MHELLGRESQEFETKFNFSSFHDLATLLSVSFFTFFDDFPELVGEDISALVELFFSLLIFTQVRVLISKLVELGDKSIEALLLVIESVQELQESALQV